MKFIISLVMVAGTLRMFAAHKETVREELKRLQKEGKLSLVWYEWGIRSVVFGNRSESLETSAPLFRDAQEGVIAPNERQLALVLRHSLNKSYLAIARRDGTRICEYINMAASGSMCWSPSEKKLAIVTKSENQKSSELIIATLSSSAIEPISVSAHLTSQCWSPHEKAIVYEVANDITVYDFARDERRGLASGTSPTWSPDGKWIAFLNGDTYYAIRPSGTERKELFRKHNASSPLFWSPDSRIVAYISWRVGIGVPRPWVRRRT